jgi:hypothetical protein
MKKQFQADWIRLAVLKEYGGIWLDASIILTRSLSFIHDLQETHSTEGFMYFLDYWTTDIEFPVFETWLIATIPNGDMITKWFSEYNYCFLVHRMRGYYLYELEIMYGQEMFAKMHQNIRMIWYVKTNVAQQKAMRIDGAKPFYGLAAESKAQAGPLSFQSGLNWDSNLVAALILDAWDAQKWKLPKIIKLRSGERASIIKMLETRQPAADSIYTNYLI